VCAGPAFVHGATGAKRTDALPPYIKIFKKWEALQYCDSNKFIEITVDTWRVLMSKAAMDNICSNKHKALHEYTYVNTKTHQNRLKPIQILKKLLCDYFRLQMKKSPCYSAMC
jgi:hypothetical protein